ncbi:MAG TPA: hypothetical protein VFV88_09020 [Steroidobacteraceae bacterium]|nr:hypothetical protein [Steroidobacteraceae bacterium]
MDEKSAARLKVPDAASLAQPIVSLGNPGNRPAELAGARAIADNHVVAATWRLLSEVNANLQRREEAVSDLEIALQHAPGFIPLMLRHAAGHQLAL